MICLAALTASTILAAEAGSERARHEMAEGKKEYRRANFLGAIEHFKVAAALDDDWIAAKFALAGAYASEVVPGLDTPENQRLGQQAIEVFHKILERDPQNANALKDVGLVHLNLKRYGQAREYFKKALAGAPDDPDLYYSLGWVDWAITYQDISKRKAKQGLRMDDEFKNSQASRQLCGKIRTDNQALMDEGITMLQKAMDKRQDYDDAMAYTSLLYRRKADLECSNPRARTEDLRLSRKWINEGLAARKHKGANQQPSGSKYLRAGDDGLEIGNLEFIALPQAPRWPEGTTEPPR